MKVSLSIMSFYSIYIIHCDPAFLKFLSVVRNAVFDPRTHASEQSGALTMSYHVSDQPMSHRISNQSAIIPPTNQPPHLQPISHCISNQYTTTSPISELPHLHKGRAVNDNDSICNPNTGKCKYSICTYTSGGKPFRLLYEIEIRTTQSEFSNFRIEYLDETYIFENIFTYL